MRTDEVVTRKKKNLCYHLQQMSNKTIFGLPVDVLSASNMSFTASQVDGKYVLKSGDSMSGNLAMEVVLISMSETEETSLWMASSR